jgi:hypothetical protein
VLARLDDLPGVARCRVESSGRHLALDVVPGADPAGVARAAAAALGRPARALGEAEARAQLDGRPRGDPWLSAAEVMALSYVEGRILAVRVSAAAGREAGLDADDRDRLAEAVRVEVFAAVERVHAEGGRASSSWFYDDWPEIASRVLARARAFAPPDRVAALGAGLERAVTR